MTRHWPLTGWLLTGWLLTGWLLGSGLPGGSLATAAEAEQPPPVNAPTAQQLQQYQRAADRGDANARFQIGLAAEIRADYTSAIYWYRLAAKAGVAAAATALGTLYLTGRGVDANVTTALRWYRRGAESGNPAAQHAYAAALASAPGDLRDSAAAVTWWEKAAHGGHAPAQHSLCLALRDGRGVPQDEEQALAWCVAAGAVGAEDVMQLRQRLDAGQIERAYVQAATWQREIASRRHD